VDGHVRAYHGDADVRKAHVGRMRLSMPAAVDTWVCDARGDGVLVWCEEPGNSLVRELRRVAGEVRSLVGPDARPMIIFDRGGWSLRLFAELVEAGFDIATYRKGIKPVEATRVLRSARRLRGLPVTAAAALDGSLSAGAVQAIVANVTDATAELFAEHEAELIPTLVPLCAGDVAAAMRTWAALAEDALGLGEPAEPLSKVSLSSMLDGVWRLDGHLNPLDGEILDTALRLAAGSDDDTEAPRTPAQRRANALVNIAKRFLDHEEQPPARRNRPHVNVIVTRDDLEAGRGGECSDGTVLDGPSLASLVCDSVWHRVVMAGSVILDYGTATRTISPNLFNALVVRDRHCRFPGCDRPASWADAHHVVHVEDGGPTCPSNCVLLCRRHHVRLHRKGWSAELKAQRRVGGQRPRRAGLHQPSAREPSPAAAGDVRSGVRNGGDQMMDEEARRKKLNELLAEIRAEIGPATDEETQWGSGRPRPPIVDVRRRRMTCDHRTDSFGRHGRRANDDVVAEPSVCARRAAPQSQTQMLAGNSRATFSKQTKSTTRTKGTPRR
jgi:hypothetical protein